MPDKVKDELCLKATDKVGAIINRPQCATNRNSAERIVCVPYAVFLNLICSFKIFYYFTNRMAILS
ncbi:MAG: hypothetical protein IJM10_05745 [Clostridia bacterium]|nr:hypothetical protein [Clostridia bacterium]